MRLTRRHLLGLAALLGARGAGAEPALLVTRELAVPGAGKFGKNCLLVRPARVADDTPLPLLVLFHGLAETENEGIGIHAFYDRYGLPQAYQRLTTPPVTRVLPAQRYLSDARLDEINRELGERPFTDLAMVCPFTPNVLKLERSAPLLDSYAEYIAHALLPAVRAATPISDGAEHLGVDGVSLGGYVSLEVFLRKSELFGVVGSMQGAFGKALAEVYARRIAEAVSKFGTRRIHITTSSFDPFRDSAVLLERRLGERGISATLTLADGPHDQRFLREAGTLEMLLYQARSLTPG